MRPAKIEEADPSKLDPDSLVKDIVGGRLREAHFMGLLYGATLFYDKRRNLLCFQENANLKCCNPSDCVDTVTSKIKEAAKRSDKVVLLS